MLKNQKLAVRIGIYIGLAMMLTFLVIWVVIDGNATDIVTDSITNQMTDSAESRVAIINDYVSSAEEYMVAFAQSDEVRNALLYPDNSDIIARAQQYTVDFANVKGIFEGLYIAGTDTEVYTHTSEGAIGIHTREGEALKELQETMMTKKEVTNSGIMKSPGTGNMVISMYYPLFDESDRCIGYVGSAVYASNLMDSLLSLDIKGLPDSEYIFLNSETGTYLYNKDEKLLNTKTEDEGFLEILEEIKNNPEITTGIKKVTSDNGDNAIVVYKNIPERKWVFIVKDDEKNVYAALAGIRRITGVACFLAPVCLLLVLVAVLLMVSRQLKLVEKSIGRLGRMDLSEDGAIKKYVGRRDEVGIICSTLNNTAERLRVYITEIDRQMAAMSDGDFTVKSNVEYVGAFKTINKSLQLIQESLRKSFVEIADVTAELSTSSHNVSSGAANLADAADNEKSLTFEIDANVSDIAEKVAYSTSNAVQAKEQTEKAASVVAQSKDKMDELMGAMERITDTANQIVGINANMERIAKQTQILALNATVEATRAGVHGKGFAVVANEIRALAEQSNSAAEDAFNLIEQTIEAVTVGTSLTDDTAECLYNVVEQTSEIEKSVSGIAEASVQQKDKLSDISRRLKDIGDVVEMTAATAKESADASLDLDKQIKVLQNNLRRYKV